MNETLDSQLSAMFDDELPAAECELLARRLSRDELLQSRWRHYALIGAAVRGEGGLALNIDLSSKVRKALAAEAELNPANAAVSMPQSLLARRAWQGLAALGVAAGVAAVSVMWLRAQGPDATETLVAQSAQTLSEVSRPSGPDRYVVPPIVESSNPVPTAELANYVVAHSEYSAPLGRRNLLSSLVASDAGTSALPEQSEETDEAALDTDANDAQKPK